MDRSAADWAPGASREALVARAAILARIRSFFAARAVLEVETPQLCPVTATDPLLASVPAYPFADGRAWYLQTSPEFPMKRLLAAGSGPIYQLGKCFRRAEHGPRHNPEFTMLEWYRPGFGLDELLAEVAELVGEIVPGREVRREAWRELFERHVGLDPFDAPLDALRERAAASAPQAGDWDRDTLLDLLFSAHAEPRLGHGCLQFVDAFPAARASLARTTRDARGAAVAARFELFLDGLEIANGYDELCDAAELARRFAADNAARRAAGLDEVPEDARLLAAMTHGLPECSGVALGVDRLVMVALGAATIDAVVSFTASRA